MAYEFIEVTEVGAVMVVTMDDPPTRNAIGNEMADEINQAIDHLESDTGLRALVLTGRDPSFCSGGSLALTPCKFRARELPARLAERAF